MKHGIRTCVRCQQYETVLTVDPLHNIQLEILAMQMVISYRKSDINCLFGGVTALLTETKCFENFLLLQTSMEYTSVDKDAIKLHIIRQWGQEEALQLLHANPSN